MSGYAMTGRMSLQAAHDLIQREKLFFDKRENIGSNCKVVIEDDIALYEPFFQ